MDLSAITSTSFNTLNQVTFVNCPNLTSIKLPSTITTIANYAINTTPKLTTVNFDNLTKLTTINMSNFDGSILSDINLSNTAITTINVGSFKNLPTTAQVSFPTTLNDGFQNIFTDTENNTIPFNFPNGINEAFFTTTGSNITLSNNILQNIQTASGGKANVLKNASILNLSNTTSIKSIGVSTFFESSKLSSLTLPAKIVANNTNTTGIFNTNATITANTNLESNPSDYIKTKLPFGNNELLTSLNFSTFTNNSTSLIDDTSNQETLFNKTNTTT